MIPAPKTIQIFLPGGDPRGIRIAEITTRILQVIEVPRSLLQDFVKMPESVQVALYFLFGGEGEDEAPKVYIGQTGDLRARLAKHNEAKGFWQRVLVLISRTNSLTQTHGLFLEWCSLQASKKAARYAHANGNSGSKPHTPAPLEADCLEIFETGRTLLATLGFPIFEPVAAPIVSDEPSERLYLKTSVAEGSGLYTTEGFVVLKGSVARKGSVPSIVGTAEERFRQKLLDAGVMQDQGETLVFVKDHLFGSPSMAAIALIGGTANGWKVWKSMDGKTLHELKRAPLEVTP